MTTHWVRRLTTAAALCAKRGELPRELDYHLVQDALQKAGCTLFDQE